MGISVGLDIAVRALLAQQQAVSTVSHNVANATTAGYSRQRVQLAAVPGVPVAGGIAGAGGGVNTLGVQRVRDLFVDFQLRTSQQQLGYHSARASSLQQAELALGEPGDAGLRAAMSRFWNSWRDLANEPESTAARAAVTQSGATFASTARRVHDSLVNLRADANARIRGDLDEVNMLTTEVAQLNKEIVYQQAAGDNASDLADRRDLALDRLSMLMNTTVVTQANGSLDVVVGGNTLVAGDRAFAIQGTPNAANSNYVDITIVRDGSSLVVTGGEIGGLLEQRDTDLVGRITGLNNLIGQIVTDVNTAHSAGFGLDGVTGRAFFAGTNASDITVDAVVLADRNAVAASSTLAGVPGDGNGAAGLADLQYLKALGGGTATFDEFYAGFVGELGSGTREAEHLASAQSLVRDHIEQVRQGASGVNLDEEMIQMMQYQRAYEAAGRLVSILDEMLDHLINRMI